MKRRTHTLVLYATIFTILYYPLTNARQEEEEEEEEEVATNPPASQTPATQPPSQPDSRAGSQTPKPSPTARPPGDSRATSPMPSPTLGGHSLVAKRAAGDKVSKPNISRGNSPTGSRATSPVSQASSPTASGQVTNGQKKRKAEELPNGSPLPGTGTAAAPKPKKRKAQPAVPSTMSTAELKGLLVEWLKNTPEATTRECIHHFSPYLTDQERKAELIGLVKEVAQLKNGMLILRQKSSATPIPTSPPTTTVS
jgi:transcription initiation factor TFIIF subunit alpha